MAIDSKKPGRLFSRFRGAAAALLLSGVACVAQASGYAAYVVDASTGEILQSVNPDQAQHPASLTKMMTLYLAFQALQSGKFKPEQELPVSAWAASRAPTKLDLRTGQTVAVQDCILGMVTKSANDAATVVAEALGGSEGHFVEMMNAQALLLGMTGTHFGSASGLPNPNDATTARDMAKLSMALYRDFPQYSHYFATKEFMFRGQLVRGHNHLMDRYPGMDGLKTGFTGAAGFNLASTAVHDGHRLFGVVLGGRTAAARDQLMARLLDDGFAHRQTPPVLVAQAGGASRGAMRSMLAALSPIQTADAEPSPAPAPAKHRRVRGKRAAAPVASAAVAKAGCKPARKGAKAACAQRKVAAAQPGKRGTKLARHTAKGKHKEIVASRRSEPRD